MINIKTKRNPLITINSKLGLALEYINHALLYGMNNIPENKHADIAKDVMVIKGALVETRQKIQKRIEAEKTVDTQPKV